MTQPADSHHYRLPIPQRQFKWYLTFWHICYLGMLAWLAVGMLIDWWQPTGISGVQLLTLLGLLLVQTLLYLRLVIFNPHWAEQWPLPATDLALYFGGSLICWLLEWRIEAGFFWIVMSYMGQMFGILPPIAALPSVSLLYLIIQAEGMDWNFSELSSGQVIGSAIGWLGMLVIYLFIWYLIRTSTERGNLVQQLQQAQQALALTREKDVELAALRERERLARDLHDSLGHALVTMSVQLEAIQRLYRVDAERGSAHIDELKSLVRRSMGDLRRSLAGLRTPGLGDRQLGEALRDHCVEISQQTGLAITCQLAEEVDQLSPTMAEVIWRLIQESLTNVSKHAQARHVQVQLRIDPKSVLISVEDDGVGLPNRLPNELENLPGHYGLRGLRERVEGLGGSFSVASQNSSQNSGTKVEASFPVV